MTGLDIEKDKIMEVACLVTDAQLNIIAEGPNLIIHQSQDTLENMNEWCIKQHGKSGLTAASFKSELSIADADDLIVDFIKKHVQKKMSPLAGNSVYMDRLFLRKFMPKVEDYLHYRIVDVSSVKELCRRWNGNVLKQMPKKGFVHRSLDDIRDSVAELKFYKDNFFKMQSS